MEGALKSVIVIDQKGAASPKLQGKVDYSKSMLAAWEKYQRLVALQLGKEFNKGPLKDFA